MGFSCIYNNPYNQYNPMNNFGMDHFDMFGMNKLNRFNDFNFDNNLAFQEPAFVIDYIDASLLFFTPNNNYIFVLYRESASLAIHDLETLESKGRIYDQSSTNSIVQWFNSSGKINYLILAGSGKIEIINPLVEKNRSIYIFKDDDNLKGSNYAYSILYNFRDNYDYLLSYTRYKINIINLNLKIIAYSLEMKYNINSVLSWNKKYLIIAQGDNYGKEKFNKLTIVHIDSKKNISLIAEKNGFVKSTIKKIKFLNNDFMLFVSDAENKIKLWETL